MKVRRRTRRDARMDRRWARHERRGAWVRAREYVMIESQAPGRADIEEDVEV